MQIELYKAMDCANFEHNFIYQCAPVIAGVKVSNLLGVKTKLSAAAAAAARISGLESFDLCESECRCWGCKKSMILIYSEKKLLKQLFKHENNEFLNTRGILSYNEYIESEFLYAKPSVKGYLHYVLSEISRRYHSYEDGKAEFPHEIGVILGYPLEDVKGYMENGGQKCLLNGYWKVYNNPEEAKRKFEIYDEVTESLMKSLLSDGCSFKSILTRRFDRAA